MIGMSNKRGKLASIISENSKVEKVASGFKFVEGPVWNGSKGFLLFSDIPADRIYKWSQQKGVEAFREPSGNSNGLTYDKAGRLIICEHGNRRVSRIEKDGSYTVLAEKFRGKRLNSPNDVVVKSDGAIYFTDPPYGIKPEQQELPFQGVFRLDPLTKKLTLLVKDFPRPNGLAFSPDEKVLYVADSSTEQRHVRAFNVQSDGTLSNGRVFAETRSKKPGNPDGIKVDIEGHLYVSASGVWIFDENGKHLGTIETPETPANIAWGGEDWKTLYITARTSLYCVRLNVAGIKVL
jgi:gluconolactonase